jgi:undecaprenyl diphosphate synthase
MSLLVITLNEETQNLIKNNIRLLVIGEIDHLPKQLVRNLKRSMEITSKNTGLKLILALSYSARWEILDAIRKIAGLVKEGKVNPEKLSFEFFTEHLQTKDIPDPELLIRTSGEYRVSNFLLWQIAYTELYFTETLWPDFGKEDMYKAICNYQMRERRFGKISEQVEQ